MAKEFTKRCPDCDGYDGVIFTEGNKKCKFCHGTGKKEDWSGLVNLIPGAMIINSVVENLAGKSEKDLEDCPECSGTGQCQTCGGEGIVHYDVDNEKSSNDDDSSNDEDSENNSDDYFSYTSYNENTLKTQE